MNWIKIETRHIITTALVIIFLGVLFLFPKHHKAEAWKKYSSKNIGIEFEIPDSLQPFPSQAINFSEYEGGPGFIDVQTEFVGAKTALEVVQNLHLEEPEQKSQKNIAKKIINGSEAIITTSSHEDSDQEQKTMYLVHGNMLFTISSRWIDQERFWNSIKFLP